MIWKLFNNVNIASPIVKITKHVPLAAGPSRVWQEAFVSQLQIVLILTSLPVDILPLARAQHATLRGCSLLKPWTSGIRNIEAKQDTRTLGRHRRLVFLVSEVIARWTQLWWYPLLYLLLSYSYRMNTLLQEWVSKGRISSSKSRRIPSTVTIGIVLLAVCWSHVGRR